MLYNIIYIYKNVVIYKPLATYFSIFIDKKGYFDTNSSIPT